jgi:hypothetical protein
MEIKGTIRQGEVLMIPLARVEGDLRDVKRENGRFILGHSENGHHHVIKEPWVTMREPATKCSFYLEGGQELNLDLTGLGVAVCDVSEPANLIHESVGGHLPHAVDPGVYLVLRQRERSFADIAAYRPVAD